MKSIFKTTKYDPIQQIARWSTQSNASIYESIKLFSSCWNVWKWSIRERRRCTRSSGEKMDLGSKIAEENYGFVEWNWIVKRRNELLWPRKEDDRCNCTLRFTSSSWKIVFDRTSWYNYMRHFSSGLQCSGNFIRGWLNPSMGLWNWCAWIDAERTYSKC